MNNIYHIVPAKWFIKPDPYEPIGLKKKYWIKGPTRKSIDKVDWAPEHMDAKNIPGRVAMKSELKIFNQ